MNSTIDSGIPLPPSSAHHAFSANEVEAVFARSRSPKEFVEGYLAYLTEVLSLLDTTAVGTFIDVVLAARERNARIFFIGNGGSAATASHFANDIAIGTRCLEKPFRAVSLTDNLAVITAIANDFGYDEIFVQQLKTQLSNGDLVVAISASGNSPNIVRAIEYANAAGAFTIGLTGFDGGALRRLATLSVHVPSHKGEYGPVEDVHMILDHVLGAYLAQKVRASV